MRTVLACLVLALTMSGCATGGKRCDARSPAIVVPTPPPEPLTDVTSGPPAYGMSLIEGHWHWDGVRWVWIPSRWVTPPPGQRWAPPEIGHDDEHTTFREGGFVCSPED